MILKILLGLVMVSIITAAPILLAIVMVKLDEITPPRWVKTFGFTILVMLGLLMCYLVGDVLI